MRPVTIALTGIALLVGIYAGYRMSADDTEAKVDTEERVLIERARGHITASEAEAIRSGLHLVRDRDNGMIRPTTVGEAGPYTVGAFNDDQGGRDLIIEGPPVSTAIADGPCIVTSLAKWLRPGITVAHCAKAGFESIVTVSDLAGEKYIVSLSTPANAGPAGTTTTATTTATVGNP